ncbi:MAG: phosphopantetheine-binding protein [Cyanobacteria bacterium P01_H01_bin.121]
MRYASAGSLYPVQAYLWVKPDRLAELAGGFYYYHPDHHQLMSLGKRIDLDTADIETIFGTNQPLAERSAFSLFLVGQLPAIEPIYGEQSRDLCLLEAGYMSQLLMETAPDHDLGLCPLGGLNAEPLTKAFDLDADHILLHGFVGGAIDPAWTQTWQPPEIPRSATTLTESLRQYLAQKLPSYMVPSHFQILEALPLSANGKVDRQALPDPTLNAEPQAYVAPRNDLEQAIVDIWQTTLELELVGIHDNFFDRGGNSLTAMQLVSQLRQAFQIEVSLRQFFLAPTPAEQATLIQTQQQDGSTAVAEVPIQPIARQPRLGENLNVENLSPDQLDQLSEQDMDQLLQQLLATGEEQA